MRRSRQTFRSNCRVSNGSFAKRMQYAFVSVFHVKQNLQLNVFVIIVIIIAIINYRMRSYFIPILHSLSSLDQLQVFRSNNHMNFDLTRPSFDSISVFWIRNHNSNIEWKVREVQNAVTMRRKFVRFAQNNCYIMS